MNRTPRVAAVTMVRDEGAMLRAWVDHYGRQLGHDHLLVLDDGSTDGSTDGLPCTVTRIKPITGHFELSRMELVSAAAAKLLRRHDAVLFADADEFIVADPARHDSLPAFVAARPGIAAAGVVALNVIHHVSLEPALDLHRPVLAQRSLVKFMPLMCKPALKWVKNPWAAASHGIRDAPFAIDPDLWMFHLKFADREGLRATAQSRRAMVEADGRAAASSWQFTGDEMVQLLDRVNAELPDDVADIPEFSASPSRLDGIVQTFDGGVTRATGARQAVAMERRPARRIPPRFRGAF